MQHYEAFRRLGSLTTDQHPRACEFHGTAVLIVQRKDVVRRNPHLWVARQVLSDQIFEGRERKIHTATGQSIERLSKCGAVGPSDDRVELKAQLSTQVIDE